MTKMQRTARITAVAAAAFVLGASAPAAHAADQTAADDQYGAVLGEQSGTGQGQGALPFTGLDLVLLLAAGTGLSAAGVAVKRLAD